MQPIIRIVIHKYRSYNYGFYFVHLNILFWEWVRRFHQTLRGVHGTKKVKNLWSTMSTIFQIKQVSCTFVEVFRDTVTVLRSIHAQLLSYLCIREAWCFVPRSLRIYWWALRDCDVSFLRRSRTRCHWSPVSRPTSIPVDFSVTRRALYKQDDIPQWNINPSIIFWSNILILWECSLSCT